MKISKSALMKSGAAIIILCIGLGVMFLLSSSKAEANKREVDPPVRKVETMIPLFGNLPFLVKANGLVESAGSLVIQATASGKVTSSLNNLVSGTPVSKGDILLEIDSRQVENSLNLARAELVKAVASLVPQFKSGNELLYNKWNNYLDSLNFQRSAVKEIPAAESSREKLLLSTYGIYSSYYNVKNAEIMLEQHTLISPFDGYLSGEGILPGSFVNAGQVLFTLVDAENLKVAVPLTIDDLNRIDVGALPLVNIRPSMGTGSEIQGFLVGREILMDSSSQMINVNIEFRNPSLDVRFAPGNYVDISIEGMILDNTAAVPRHAVIDNSFVYTFKNELLGKESVNIRAVSDDIVFIDNTLPPETKIITTILQKPLIGMKLSSLGGTNEKDS